MAWGQATGELRADRSVIELPPWHLRVEINPAREKGCDGVASPDGSTVAINVIHLALDCVVNDNDPDHDAFS